MSGAPDAIEEWRRDAPPPATGEARHWLEEGDLVRSSELGHSWLLEDE
jgi:hypothetical protein